MHYTQDPILPSLKPGSCRWFIGLFVLFVLLPNLVYIFHRESPEVFMEYEKRRPAPAPGLISSREELEAWPGIWEDFYNDRLGLRREAIRIGALLKWVFHLPDSKVLRGKDSWMFLRRNQAILMSEYLQGELIWEEKHLRRFLGVMERRQAWLKAQDIPFLFVITPVKGRAYPEYLPGNIRQQSPTLPEQFLTLAAETGTPLRILDILPALEEQKEKDSNALYYQTDTHWNEYGAYTAYLQVIKELQSDFPDLTPINMAELDLVHLPGPGNDLARMQGLAWYLREGKIYPRPTQRTHIQTVTFNNRTLSQNPQECFDLRNVPPTMSVEVETDLKDAPRVLVIRDSFTDAMSFYYNETFQAVRYEHHRTLGFKPEIVEEFKPDLVIYQVVGRAFISGNVQFDRFEKHIIPGE